MNSTHTLSAPPSEKVTGTAKWGDAAPPGYFQVVPDILLMRQHDLGLSATDLVVLLNLTSHWWEKDRPPFPRPETIAKRMNLNVRSVQRSIRTLLKKGYVSRLDVTSRGRERRALSLDGLVEELGRYVRTDPRLAAQIEAYKQRKGAAELDSLIERTVDLPS